MQGETGNSRKKEHPPRKMLLFIYGTISTTFLKITIQPS